MHLELHIWGPAFGLPSIEPECIAAAVYVARILDSADWSLIVAHDPSQSPTGDFPALHHNSTWIGGFPEIVDYLASQGYSSLDHQLSPRERADSKALTAHLRADALPLVDAILYTSSENFTKTTRPAWTRIVPSHTNFVVPPRRQEVAKSRTKALGLSSGSVDDLPVQEASPQHQQEARIISSSPSLIFGKKKTLQDALKAQQSRNLFRLEALTEDLVEPIIHFLGDKPYLLSSHPGSPNSIDCLAFGYLSLLMNIDQLENNWVGETAKKKFPAIARYVEHLQMELLPSQQPKDVADIVQDASSASVESAKDDKQFPWAVAISSTPVSIFKSLGHTLLSHFIHPVQQHILFSWSLLRNSEPTALRPWYSPSTLLLTLTGPLITGFGYLLYVQTHSNLERHKRFGKWPTPELQGLGQSAHVLSALSSR